MPTSPASRPAPSPVSTPSPTKSTALIVQCLREWLLVSDPLAVARVFGSADRSDRLTQPGRERNRQFAQVLPAGAVSIHQHLVRWPIKCGKFSGRPEVMFGSVLHPRLHRSFRRRGIATLSQKNPWQTAHTCKVSKACRISCRHIRAVAMPKFPQFAGVIPTDANCAAQKLTVVQYTAGVPGPAQMP